MGARQFHKLEVGGSSPSSATIVRRTLSAKLIEMEPHCIPCASGFPNGQEAVWASASSCAAAQKQQIPPL